MADDLVLDRFRIGERIGAGGMGVVHRALDERLGREVAIKEVVGADGERVIREAQAAARLNHPAIVTLYELGRRGDRALLVSELVRGSTLDRLRSAGRLTDREVAEVGADLCAALAHAHERGVVHRDLKPQNVIVPDDGPEPGRAKLMDFGIARLAGAPALTASGEVVGTLAYMAPEQAEGAEAGAAADVYSLALTLYECWAGANPVGGASPAETARRIGAEVESLAEARPDLPRGLAAAIDACLEPDPARRPPPRELGRVLAATAGRLGAEPVPPPPEPHPAPEPRARPSLARLLPLMALAAAIALLAGPAGVPGAALVAGVLLGPAALLLPGRATAALALAPPLAVAGMLAAHPGLAAHAGARFAPRALAGGLGWCWALAAGLALGAGPRLGLAPRAPGGWEASAPEAAAAILAPLLEPGALIGAATLALAAGTLGWALDRHLAIAALAALVWAAALAAALPLAADGSLGDRPLAPVLGAGLGLAIEWTRRSRGASPAPPRRGARAPSGHRLAPSRTGMRAVS